VPAPLDFPKPVVGQEPASTKAEPAPPQQPPAPPQPQPQATVAAEAPAPIAEKPTAEKPIAEKKPEPTPAPKAPSRFKIQFSSIPSATLYVDGRKIGPSIPARVVDLTEGTHRIKLEVTGMPTYEKELHVGPSTDTRFAYRFPVGFLVIQAPEWAGASVLIDSKFKGVLGGESRFQLPSGDHRVTLSREGVDPVTANVFVPEGDKHIWSPPAPVLHPASSH